jgi:phage I-like protein
VCGRETVNMTQRTASLNKTATVFTSSVYACALSVVAAGSRVQLLPAGLFRAADGRPGNLGIGYADWRMDAQAFAACQDMAQARTNDFVFDYEHQTLLTAQNGQPNPAAGWFKQLELTDTGLWALDVRWTDKAKAAITAGEYRYVSAVFACDDTGAVVRLHSAALTNTPALDGMAAVALTALSTQLNSQLNFDSDPNNLNNPNPEDAPMKLLLTALALQESASEAQAIVALGALQSQFATAKAAAFDPAKHIALTEHTALQGELVALKGKVETAERDALMALCMADGRIAPAQQAYWAGQPLNALTAYAQVATPNPAMSKASQAAGAGNAANKGKPPGADYHALSDEMKKIVDDTGMSPEAFNAAGGMKVAKADE